jgi:hypothetical protein
MGSPVRIDDLARRMIALMGLTVRDESNPEGDIAIEYTGLRPGEKLYEELLIGGNVARTAHPMIMRALEHSLPWSRIKRLVEELRTSVRNFDCQRALRLLDQAVVEYEPPPVVSDLVAIRRAQTGLDVLVAPGFQERRRQLANVISFVPEAERAELPEGTAVS